MPAIELKIDARDVDIQSTVARYYGPEDLFIEQIENETGIKHTLLFKREAIPDVMDALMQFLHDPCKS